MKKVLRYLLPSIIVMVSIFYLWPVKKENFASLYNGDPSTQQSLEVFRSQATQSVSNNGQKWDYLISGSGDRTLVFLHGMGGAYDIWWQQIDKLKSQYQIISITLPQVHTLEEATSGILIILNEHNIDKATLIGSSMGGYITQYFLQKYPEKLQAVVLGNTFPPNHIYQEQNGALRKKVPFIPAWMVMSAFRKNVSEVVVPASEDSPLVEAYLHEQYAGLMSKGQFIGRMDIVLDYYEPKLDQVHQSIPKLIIESDNDPLILPELQNGIKTLYPEAEVFTFSGKGHFPYLNDAEQYTKVLQDYFKLNGQ